MLKKRHLAGRLIPSTGVSSNSTAHLLNLELLLHIQGFQLSDVCKETLLHIFAGVCDTAIKRLVLSSAQRHCCVNTDDAVDLSSSTPPDCA